MFKDCSYLSEPLEGLVFYEQVCRYLFMMAHGGNCHPLSDVSTYIYIYIYMYRYMGPY